jgi:hypothetical protein
MGYALLGPSLMQLYKHLLTNLYRYWNKIHALNILAIIGHPQATVHRWNGYTALALKLKIQMSLIFIFHSLKYICLITSRQFHFDNLAPISCGVSIIPCEVILIEVWGHCTCYFNVYVLSCRCSIPVNVSSLFGVISYEFLRKQCHERRGSVTERTWLRISYWIYSLSNHLKQFSRQQR